MLISPLNSVRTSAVVVNINWSRSLIMAGLVSLLVPLLSYSKPVIVIDIHGTGMEQRTSLAVKEFLKGGPINCARFWKRYRQYQQLQAQRQTELPSVEAYVLQGERSSGYAQMVSKVMNCFVPMRGAVAFLKQLKQAGYQIFVFSNIGPLSYRETVRQFPAFFKLFDGAIITHPGQLAKTSAQAYQRCLSELTQLLGYPPERVVFFDDSAKNCDLAERTDPRFTAVWCNREQPVAARARLWQVLKSLAANTAVSVTS